MTYTIAMIAIFALLFLANIAITGLLLMHGMRWAKAEDPTYRRSFIAAITASIVCYVLTVLVYLQVSSANDADVLDLLLLCATPIAANIIVIKIFFGTTVLRTIQGLLPTIIAPVIFSTLLMLVIQPFVGEAFVVPTGSMAPTLLGTHIKSSCETCDQPAFVGASTEARSGLRQHCICVDFHSNEVEASNGRSDEGDRIYVVKLLKPQRWDITAFKLPSDPRIKYVKRLVGLPGETVHIESGSLYVDGEKLTPPERIADIVYSDSIGYHKGFHGTAENPAVLGPDEYFMLGDNTEAASDSRFWNSGAPGHNPYAVPESYIEGVVTTIYWPPKRWRSFK